MAKFFGFEYGGNGRALSWQTRLLCALMGVWGVANGFAVFILMWVKGRDNPFIFLACLGVAAIVAWIAESMRELIQSGCEPAQGSPWAHMLIP